MGSKFLLPLIFFLGTARAAPVRHTLLPGDSIISAETQHACGSYALQVGPQWCNPALYSYSSESPLKADVAVNADQDAYETTDRFLSKTVDKDFVASLFRNKAFQSFSALGRLTATTPYGALTYTPAYVVGAYRLTNPNLPELEAEGMRSSDMRFTYGRPLYANENWEAHWGGSVFHAKREFYAIQTNALELVVKDVDQLLQTETKTVTDADLGFALTQAKGLGFGASLLAQNIFHEEEANDGIDLSPVISRRTRLGLSYTRALAQGHFHLGLQLPFDGAFEDFDRYGSSVSAIYGVGRLRLFASYSALMNSFGFSFYSTHYQVGIQYANDKQDNSLELRRQNHVYLFFAFNF